MQWEIKLLFFIEPNLTILNKNKTKQKQKSFVLTL